MPPDTLPPDDAREPDDNVVDPDVLAERRAQRAELSERSAVRRAADAQTLAADLARERARLEAERDAARAEASAAREGADVVKAEARHVQVERDTLRAQLERARAECDALRAERSPEPAAIAPNGNGHGPTPTWAADLGRELTVARGAVAQAAAAVVPAAAAAPMLALTRERELVARRSQEPPGPPAASPPPRGGGDRAAPVTALALERERSNRLQALLERRAAVERELREQVAALERSVSERRAAEQRIEAALRRVREQFEAASRATAARGLAPAADPAPVASAEVALTAAPAPAAAAPLAIPVTPAASPAPVGSSPPPATAPDAAAPALDAERLNAARERLRATAPADAVAAGAAPALPSGPPAPWLAAALRRLTRDDPATAGRILVGMLPAQGLVTHRGLRYDLVLGTCRCIGVDVGEAGTRITRREQPRARRDVDFRLTADEAGLARLLLGQRSLLRRRAKVRGSRRRLRELRRLAAEPLALRDLAGAGAAPDPTLAFWLAALAVDPVDTYGHRFTIAHAPLAGGPADAWLRVRNGEPPAVLSTRPGEAPSVTIRSTRGGLLSVLADIGPAPGEAAAVDGDLTALALLRSWIARTEFPVG